MRGIVASGSEAIAMVPGHGRGEIDESIAQLEEMIASKLTLKVKVNEGGWQSER